jgi:adenosylcobinamide-phosphate synthase
MLLTILLAAALDFIMGDPYNFPHPVRLMGSIINFEEKISRKITGSPEGLKISGLIIVLLNILLGFFIPLFILTLLKPYRVLFTIANIYLISTCISAKSLKDEAMKVFQALGIGLEEARRRLSYIVGRDTAALEEKEIIKATVETVAENTSDGVIAPLLFIMLLGAPGGFMYKFVNTMDSMLGYKNDKYQNLGFYPAKVDDLFNLIPARLTGLLMILSSLGRFDSKNGLNIMLRDRKNHDSPNASYPEGATAGLLGIQLGGPSYYKGKPKHKPTLGDKRVEIAKGHIRDSIEIMFRSEILMLIFYALLSLLF